MTHVIVAGGGAVGEQVARVLEASGNTVVVVESDAARASDLVAGGLHVVRGDASSPRWLETAGALHAGVLVACTEHDEENLVIAVLARRHFAIARVVTIVRDDANRWLFDESWGVDAAISSASALASLIEAASGSAQIVHLTDLAGERLVLVEVNLTTDSTAIARTVGELELPGDDVAAAVLRGDRALAATGDLKLQVGDRILVVTNAAHEARVRDAFYPAAPQIRG